MPVPPWKMSFCCLRFSFRVGGERRGSRGCTNHNLHIWICLFIHLRGRTMVEQVPPHWPWRHNLQGEGIDGKYEDKDKDDLPGILRSQLGGGWSLLCSLFIPYPSPGQDQKYTGGQRVIWIWKGILSLPHYQFREGEKADYFFFFVTAVAVIITDVIVPITYKNWIWWFKNLKITVLSSE